MSVVAVIQARTGSTRLPGKVLLPLAGAPALQRMIERAQRAQTLERIIVATTTAPGDDPIQQLCASLGIACVRGPVDDVLARFAAVAEGPAGAAGWLVRLTGDCPLVSPHLIDRLVIGARDGAYDYVSNIDPPTWPDGLDVEVMTREVLLEAHGSAELRIDREHVTPWIRRNSQRQLTSCGASPTDLSHLRWTLDEPEDYVLVAAVYSALHGRDEGFSTDDVLEYLRGRPEIAEINARFGRNTAYLAAVEAERQRPS